MYRSGNRGTQQVVRAVSVVSGHCMECSTVPCVNLCTMRPIMLANALSAHTRKSLYSLLTFFLLGSSSSKSSSWKLFIVLNPSNSFSVNGALPGRNMITDCIPTSFAALASINKLCSVTVWRWLSLLWYV